MLYLQVILSITLIFVFVILVCVNVLTNILNYLTYHLYPDPKKRALHMYIKYCFMS